MHDNLFHINIGQNDYIQFVFKKKSISFDFSSVSQPIYVSIHPI